MGPVEALMLFPTFAFFVFFLVVLVVYWLIRGHAPRKWWLLAASIYFYASWNPWLISLIAFSASVDYLVALALERVSDPGRRRLLLGLSVGTNLGLLAFFKYVNFFLHTAGDFMGLPPGRLGLDVILPLGISFYTFETISYIVDVYRGRTRAVRSLLDYALYILFFPHLVAGPIVRPHDFLPQLRRRKRFSWNRAQVGVQLFVLGLFKKAVLADHLAAVIDPVFAEPASFGSAAAWLAIVGYAAQIYCDFSGYSDMALGLAHLLGFHLPANFRFPYFACNVAELWRRWHISLSSWLRDYLFIPLGGSHGGKWKTCRNLIITMALGGLWHGAAWSYVVWGFYHGLLLTAHRIVPLPRWLAKPWARPLAVAGTFVCVCVGWAIFRCQTLSQGFVFLGRMFWPGKGLGLEPQAALTVVGIVFVVFLGHLAGTFWDWRRLQTRVPELALGAALAGVLLLTLLLLPEDGKAFIYFQF
jgi:alginate O-acetyltransferase complex protein AlgI